MDFFLRIARRPGLVLVLVFATYLALREGLREDGVRKLVLLGENVEQMETENARLRGEIERARRRVAALKAEPAALERAAREHGYVRQGELLFTLE